MKPEPGKWYAVNGDRMKHLKTFSHRGIIIWRFAYPNGQVLDINPGDAPKIEPLQFGINASPYFNAPFEFFAPDGRRVP